MKKKITKLHVRKGDTVKVLSGNDRGKTGKVLDVYPKDYKAIIEGVNMVFKHVKPSASNPEGGINKQEAPVALNKLMVVDPSTGEPTRIGRKLNDKGQLQRYSKKTGEFITNG